MKSIKVQYLSTLMYACAVLLIHELGYEYALSAASSSQKVWLGLATLVACMQDSMHTLRFASKVHSGTDQVEVSQCNYAYWLFRLFSHRTECFIIIYALLVLKPFVSLTGRLVACSARIAANRQTDQHTNQVL